MNRKMFTRIILIVFVSALLNQVWAACSPYIGYATLNEVHRVNGSNQANTADDYIEVRRLNSAISNALFESWSIKVCSTAEGCQSGQLADSTATSENWFSLIGNPFPSQYIDFNQGFHVELLDENDNLIDILIHNSRNSSYTPSTSTSAGYSNCPFLYDTDSVSSSASGQRQVQRDPDSIGAWDAPSGNSTDPTESNSNNGPTAPTLTVSDAFASPGSNAFVLFELSAPLNGELRITVASQDGTALDGTDYTAIADGTVITIPEGETQTYISVWILDTATEGRTFTVNVVDLSGSVDVTDNSGQVFISSVNMCANLSNNTGPLIYAREELRFSGSPLINLSTSSSTRQSQINNSFSQANGALNSDLTVSELTYFVPQILPSSAPTLSGGRIVTGSTFLPGNYSLVSATGGIATFDRGTYYIEELQADIGTRLELRAGDYFIDQANLTDVTVVPMEQGVNLYIGQQVSLTNGALGTTANHPDDLSIYVYPGATISLNADSSAQALIFGYSNLGNPSEIIIGASSKVDGAILSKGIVTFQGVNGADATEIIYSNVAYEAIKERFSCPPELPDPYIEYQFDEQNWTGATGEVIDNSGFNRNATADAASSTTTTDDNVICRAANLSVGNRFIRTPLLPPLQTTSTLSFWIKTEQSGNSNPLLAPALTGVREARSRDGIFWGWINANGNINFSAGNRDIITSTVPINDNTYRHIAITFDSSNGRAEIYINGVLDAVGSTSRGSIATAFDQLGFVKQPDTTSPPYLDALVDEFLVYDKVLSSAQIARIYNLQSSGKNLDGTDRVCRTTAPIAQYLMNETNWSGADSIVDSQGLYNGDPFGNANTQLYTNTCYAGSFGNETPDGRAAVNGADTGIEVDSDIGRRGAILFWVRAEENLTELTQSRVLFDGSSTSADFWGGINTSGQIQFSVTDSSGVNHSLLSSAQNFTRADWLHLAFRWDLAAGYMSLSVNGTEISRLSTIPANSSLGNVTDLMFGDNFGFRATGPGNAWWGLMADARVFNSAIVDSEIVTAMQEFTPCTAIIDHFTISHDGLGVNCTPEPITLQAKLGNGAIFDRYTGTVRLTTSTSQGDWQYTGSNSFTAGASDSGEAEISFNLNDRGEITLNLSYLTADRISINIADNLITERSGNATAADDPELQFSEAGFIVSNQPNTAQVMAVDMIGRNISDVLYLKAVTTDPATGVCTALLNGTVDVEMGSQCVNPGSCAANQSIALRSGTVTTSLPANDVPSSNASFSWQTVTMDFGSDSTAPYQVTASDVGEFNHAFRYVLGNQNGAISALNGSANYFSRPERILITSRQNTNGEELDPSLSNTELAGEDIKITIAGVDSSGTTYPSFNRIDYDTNTAILDHFPIAWSADLISPTDGSEGTVTGGTVWSAEGEQLVTNIQYSEISEFSLSGQQTGFWNRSSGDFNYSLPAIDIATLVPAYIQLVSQTIADWVSPFDGYYQGAPGSLTNLSVDVQVFNALNGSIENLDNTSPALVSSSNALLKSTINSTTGGSLTSELNWIINDISDDNLLTLDAQLTDLIWQRKLTMPDINDRPTVISEFQLEPSALQLTSGGCLKDSHSGACRSDTLTVDITDQTLSYARLAIPPQIDATDSEAVIPLTLQVLSSINAGDSVFESEASENSIGNSSSEIAGLLYDGADLCSLSSCPSAGVLSPTSLSNLIDNDAELASGRGLMTYNLTTADQGILEVQLVIPTWLYWDWNNDGTSEPASTYLLFGDYQGRSPILFTLPGSR